MFKQKVSRVLAAFTTLVLVVSILPQTGFKTLVPEAHANLFGPGSHASDSCTDGQTKTKSGSINGTLETDNTFTATLSGGVGELVSITLPGKGTTSYPADTITATIDDVSSSGSWIVSYKCEGTGSGSALLNFDSLNYHLTSSWSWTTSVASPATFNATLTPSTGSYSATLNPDDDSVQAVCNLNGGTFISMSASGSDVASSGSVSGSGATRTLTFLVRNTLLTPSLKTNIDVTCTTSVGVVTNTSFTYEFINNAPPAVAVSATGDHSNAGTANFDMPVSSTDVNGNQVTISLDSCSGQWSLLGSGTNPGTPTATDTVRFTALQDQFGVFTCSVKYTDSLSAFSSALATATVNDDDSGITLTPSDLSGVHHGDDQVVNVAFNDTDDANQSDTISIVSSDPDVQVFEDDQTTPFTSIGITYDGSGDDDFDFYILTDPQYAGGEYITIGSIGGKFLDFDVPVGPSLGGSRMRRDGGSPVIEKQGGTDYSTGLSLEYKTTFGNDLKYAAGLDDKYYTQTRACWKVAVGADGKEIGRVPTTTTSSTGSTDWKLGATLEYKFKDGPGLGYSESSYGLSEYLKFTDYKLSPMGYGFNLSLDGLYGSGGTHTGDDVDQDDDDSDDKIRLPLGTGFGWGIGLGFGSGLSVNPTGDKEVDAYGENLGNDGRSGYRSGIPLSGKLQF